MSENMDFLFRETEDQRVQREMHRILVDQLERAMVVPRRLQRRRFPALNPQTEEKGE